MEFLTRFTSRVSGVVKMHPKVSGVLVSLPLAHFGLKARADRGRRSILRRLEEGSRPSPIPTITNKVHIDRSNSQKMLSQLVLPPAIQTEKHAASLKSFGVVLGPSGTGKTALVRELCARYPHGVLYHEVFEPRVLTEELTRAAGMIVKPNNLFDLLITTVSETYRKYHVLPKDSSRISYVLKAIADAGRRFKIQHGCTPVLVLDGVDLIAKTDPGAFVELIDRAKYLANEGSLRIVLVGTEGSVMPLINKSSSGSRKEQIEIVDITDKEAETFLSAVVPKDLAKGITALVGGRFIHLESALAVHERLSKRTSLSYAIAMDKIQNVMLSEIVHTSMQQVWKQPKLIRSTEKTIIDDVLSNGYVKSNELAKKHQLDVVLVQNAMHHLVSANLLRYQRDGSTVFHSRLVKWAAENRKLYFCT